MRFSRSRIMLVRQIVMSIVWTVVQINCAGCLWGASRCLPTQQLRMGSLIVTSAEYWGCLLGRLVGTYWRVHGGGRGVQVLETRGSVFFRRCHIDSTAYIGTWNSESLITSTEAPAPNIWGLLPSLYQVTKSQANAFSTEFSDILVT